MDKFMPSFGEIILLIIIVLLLWKGLSWFIKIRRFFKQQQHIFHTQQQQYRQETTPEAIELVACPTCGVMQASKQACTRTDCPNIN